MGMMEEFIKEKAGKLGASDFQKVTRNAGAIMGKLGGPLAKFAKQARLFVSMLGDYQSGQYRKVPAWTIGVAAFALLYILMPFDLVPDFIPVAGLVDDALVMATALSMVGQDLKDYENWLGKEDESTRNESGKERR